MDICGKAGSLKSKTDYLKCQKPPIIDGWHDVSPATISLVVF
jgi:hypothetical protein